MPLPPIRSLKSFLPASLPRLPSLPSGFRTRLPEKPTAAALAQGQALIPVGTAGVLVGPRIASHSPRSPRRWNSGGRGDQACVDRSWNLPNVAWLSVTFAVEPSQWDPCGECRPADREHCGAGGVWDSTRRFSRLAGAAGYTHEAGPADQTVNRPGFRGDSFSCIWVGCLL